MRKLMLDVDTLAVESFPTSAKERDPAGTVHANAATLAGCTGVASCYTSCRADMRDACTCPPP
jgi:hypothetical protein